MKRQNEYLDTSKLYLRVNCVAYQAKGINSYELVDPEGKALPEFEAGAHIDVHLPDGKVRQYSLSNAPSERYRYVIGVLRDEQGQGGSKQVHEKLIAGACISVSSPRNNFSLDLSASFFLLLAGGIGITPLKSMLHELERKGKEYVLHYCAKEKEYAAFSEAFSLLIAKKKVVMHFDQGNPENGLDLQALLKEPITGAAIYYCGPEGFMKACAQASQHWPQGSVHFEHFKAPTLDETKKSTLLEESFLIKIASTGDTYEVPADKSIADVLSENAVSIETSCLAGLCATCKIPYLEGEVDHHDFILDADEQKKYLTACVSRAKSALLVLDL